MSSFCLIDGETLVDKALFIVLLFLVKMFKVVMKFRVAKGKTQLARALCLASQTSKWHANMFFAHILCTQKEKILCTEKELVYGSISFWSSRYLYLLCR